MKRHINEGLENYLKAANFPWHMPGHKQKETSGFSENSMTCDAIKHVMSIDVTEVEGTDDLHHPEGMIKDSMDELKKIYGTYASYYLVNGSTSGIMTAITACFAEYKTSESGYDIIVARNCHKSVYNTVQLLGLKALYVEPRVFTDEKNLDGLSSSDEVDFPDVCGDIAPEDVEKLCRDNPSVKAMIITSPTYEGIISDIGTISSVAKKYNKLLIVDEAHGAHLPYMPEVGASAVFSGADMVIQSLHKTLPALTQTGILHLNNPSLEEKVKKYLSVYMTSSPSYVFLCSMESAIDWASSHDYGEYLHNLSEFREKSKSLNNIKLLSKDKVRGAGCYGYDDTRIVFYVSRKIGGVKLAKLLAEKGKIISEMSGTDYVVLISTSVDTADDFEKLYKTVKEVDEEISQVDKCKEDCHMEKLEDDISRQDILDLIGTKAIDNLYVYPPGSYIAPKGEIITEDMAKQLIAYIESGKKIRGKIRDYSVDK